MFGSLRGHHREHERIRRDAPAALAVDGQSADVRQHVLRALRTEALRKRLALLRVGERREAQPPKAGVALLPDAVRSAGAKQHVALRREDLRHLPFKLLRHLTALIKAVQQQQCAPRCH